MTIEVILAIASFVISLGGLVSVLFCPLKRRIVILTVVVAALTLTSGIALYQVYQEEKLISHVEEEIRLKLCGHTWPFDHIYDQLFFKTFPVATEALFRAVEQGSITHEIIEFRGPNNTFMKVKGYYVTEDCKGI